MTGQATDLYTIAGALQVSIGLLVRRLRQMKLDGELTLAESSALSRLDRDGPSTSAALARVEQVSPQSMGATLAALEARGLVERRRDHDDGRRILMSVTEAGSQMMRHRRSARTAQMAQALSTGFSPEELAQIRAAAPLLERLAQSI
jgi:DNA-binding MarR family transcriptional regulator